MKPQPVPIAFTMAIPAAALGADKYSEVSAQNGPRVTEVQTTQTHSRVTVGISVGNGMHRARDRPLSPSGIAVCHSRSLRRSERWPHQIIAAAENIYGRALTQPTSILVKPNDLMNWGCHRPRPELAVAPPA